MSKAKKPKPPKQHDRDKIREEFLESAFMDWTRFAEDKGWHPLQSRARFPVKLWQEEKRKILSEKQLDILSGLIYERRFKWTHQIIETLDGYPRSIDMAKNIADAKMWQISEMFKDYKVWLENGEDKKLTKFGKRPFHPFERVSMTEISMLMKGMKDITEAKLKALMLDKWAITKLDIPTSEIESQGLPPEQLTSHRITVEGQGEATPEQFQNWFDTWIDKPQIVPVTANPLAPKDKK